MRRAAALFAVAIGTLIFGLLAGCAAPGDPTARHPVVPVSVADLAARQSGSDTVLTFTLPTRSMDREALPETPAIEIYRASLTAGATPGRNTTWRLVYTIPSERVENYLKNGQIEFRDPLTPDVLAYPPDSTLAYMVRTRVVRARASADSNILALRIYLAPGAPQDVRTTVTESAVIVTWSNVPLPSGASSESYRVYRAEAEPPTGSSPRETSPTKVKSQSGLLGPSSTEEFRDSHFEFGDTYLYAVRTVAQFGAESVESVDSAASVVTPRDTFPPAAPGGLESAIVPATSQVSAYVELSWAISPEADLAGYYVYRSDSEEAAGERLNTELLPSPTFRDMTVGPGQSYYYRVSAVDRAGNESPKSSAILTVVP